MKTRFYYVLTALCLFLIPELIFAQAPAQGTTTDYVLFSTNGAMTNTGLSQITGNVGANIGSIAGFGNVNGQMHLADGSSAACAADLLTLYNQLDTFTPTVNHATSLGGGDTFVAGVYYMSAASTLNGNLYLNAQNNANAVFILQINGSLSSGANAKVILINGAQACNVFWQTEGLISLASGTSMKGIMVANAGAITLGSGVALEGRALSTTGAIDVTGVLAYTPIGCGSPVLLGPIAPDLASLACYALFAKSGTVTNTGITYVTGDVGTNVGTTSGFDTLNVTGTVHPIPDTSTATAASDLDSVYTYMNTLTHDIQLLYPATFGYNLVLTPHKYLLNAATVLTDTVYLNGGGEADAVFFIRVNGAFSTTVNSKVILTNGTKAENVYWLVNGAVSINDYSIFKGTFVANNGAVTLNTGVTLDGRAFTTVGTFSTFAITATMPPGCAILTPLVITSEPANQTICAGDSAVFTVTATGDSLTYQWRKGTVNLTNTGNITGATTNRLRIYPANIADTASNYNVIVSGASSQKDTSINVSLIVNSGPIITGEPSNQSACSGDSVQFTVTATGTNLTYQWRKDTVNLVDGVTISGATTATLTIYPVYLIDDSSTYNVIVTGDCSPGDTSVSAMLSINTAPVVITLPASKVICIGDSVSFTVVATGTGITYQWRKDTIDLVDGGNISGSKTATLTINPVTMADTSSFYNVVISGACAISNSTSSFVNLKSSGDFGVLANTAITSTGFTVISGMDVGISPGVRSSITGFPPATVINGGAIYASDDVAPPGVAAMLIQAKQDLTDAYLYAEGATAPAPATVAGDQGGKTLAPGIYKSTSTLLIQSGDLTLDAQGDANAFWIFQIASDFTTIGGAGGNVILTGGAQAKNITWQVGSSATIGNGTSFKGTILALTSITMNTGSSIDGRLLARNGAVVFSGTNIMNNPEDTASVPPVYTSLKVSLMVYTPPVITSEPSNMIVCEGDSAGFSVTATGDSLTYQWRKGTVDLTNTGNISGANTANLIINPVDFSDAGSYNVIVSGTCSPNDTSISVSLTVDIAPVITSEPYNQIVCEGSSVSFSVVATGTALTYQWRKGTVDLINTGNISGANTATLTINPVDILDAATDYNVIVSGTCSPSITSIDVSLVVNTAPVITIQSSNQVVCEGSSVSFTVVATGTALTYQWRRGTTPLVDGGNISGVHTATLTINPVTLSDVATDYNLLITGACLPDISSLDYSLTVSTSAVITIEPVDQTACTGIRTKFFVVATGTDLTYQWRRGTVNLTDGGNISGATTSELTIYPVYQSDSASDYNVVVTGVCLPSVTSQNVALSLNLSGVADSESDNTTVTFYPNPFANSLNIIINDVSQLDNCELRIYNVLGEEVVSTTITSELTTIETSNLLSGIYIYRITNNNKIIQTGRLVSQIR